MTRPAKYDRESIIRMYESGEKLCVICMILGCHQTTINKVINSIGAKQRKPRRQYSMLEVVASSQHISSRKLAELMGTTVGYVNKLRVQAKKRTASQH